MSVAYVTVRVVRKDGRPRSGRRVSIGESAFFAGAGNAVSTNSDGVAEIKIDREGRIDIYVDGSCVLRNQSIQARYTVVV